MLQITIPSAEMWDEKNNIFFRTKEVTLSMEHSLLSVSEWESRWHKPFLSSEKRTYEEYIDYYRCMVIGPVDPLVFYNLSKENSDKITQYIEDSHTATTFREDKHGPKSREIITSELIYYWMIALNIPFECEKWNLSRLLTLIRICNIKNQPPKKRSHREVINSYAEMNAARRKQWKTTG